MRRCVGAQQTGILLGKTMEKPWENGETHGFWVDFGGKNHEHQLFSWENHGKIGKFID
jgi:hypothetical protein